MSSVQKDGKKTKTKTLAVTQPNKMAEEIRTIIKSLNQFLKNYFDKSTYDNQGYAELVKQYFIEQSTNSSYSCLISSLLSKISNMLQPFIQARTIKYDISEYKLQQKVSVLSNKVERQTKKIKAMKQELSNHRQISNRLTNFVYMLKINNIDVDLLYQKGCQLPSKRQSNSYEIQLEQKGSTQFLKCKQIIGVQNYVTR